MNMSANESSASIGIPDAAPNMHLKTWNYNEHRTIIN
jgi:hypothetical protein